MLRSTRFLAEKKYFVYNSYIAWKPRFRVKLMELKTGHLYSAFWQELTSKALRMVPVNKGSHIFICHPHTYPGMEWAVLLLIPSRSASTHFGRYSFPVPLRAGGWTDLGGWLHTEVVWPPENGHPSLYQSTDNAAARDRTHDHWVASPTP